MSDNKITTDLAGTHYQYRGHFNTDPTANIRAEWDTTDDKIAFAIELKNIKKALVVYGKSTVADCLPRFAADALDWRTLGGAKPVNIPDLVACLSSKEWIEAKGLDEVLDECQALWFAFFNSPNDRWFVDAGKDFMAQKNIAYDKSCPSTHKGFVLQQMMERKWQVIKPMCDALYNTTGYTVGARVKVSDGEVGIKKERVVFKYGEGVLVTNENFGAQDTAEAAAAAKEHRLTNRLVASIKAVQAELDWDDRRILDITAGTLGLQIVGSVTTVSAAPASSSSTTAASASNGESAPEMEEVAASPAQAPSPFIAALDPTKNGHDFHSHSDDDSSPGKCICTGMNGLQLYHFSSFIFFRVYAR